MQKRKFENLGAEASVLGYGCMRFPMKDGKIDEIESERLLDRAMEAGGNYYDTAYPYHDGESEPFVGEALKKYDRKSLYIATKLPMWKIETAEQAKEVFAEQLAHLQSDYVDFYLFHALNKNTWQKVLDLDLIPIFQQYQKEYKTFQNHLIIHKLLNPLEKLHLNNYLF